VRYGATFLSGLCASQVIVDLRENHGAIGQISFLAETDRQTFRLGVYGPDYCLAHLQFQWIFVDTADEHNRRDHGQHNPVRNATVIEET